MKVSFLTLLASTVGLVSALPATQQAAYGQCGGKGYSGPTACISGYTCTYQNDYYSQCLPGKPSSPPSKPPPYQPPSTTPPQTIFSSLTIYYGSGPSVYDESHSIKQDFVNLKTYWNLGCQFDACNKKPKYPARGVKINTKGVACRFYKLGTDKTGKGYCGGESQCVTSSTPQFYIENPGCVYCNYGSYCE